jgi:hypothetical protein
MNYTTDKNYKLLALSIVANDVLVKCKRKYNVISERGDSR